MRHVVRYTMPNGAVEYHEAGTLESAAALVERARNDFGAADASIFREVPIEFKVQYKVTVADDSVGAAATPAAVPQAAHPPASPEPSADVPSAPSADVPSEPPPGAMPLTAKPSTSVDDSPGVDAAEDAENVTPISGEGASRRTLFGRS